MQYQDEWTFVTHYGEKPVLHPYHWTAYALHVAMPGWASGGPNAYANGADLPLQTLQKRGTPPAKCFVDEGDASGSAASNEGQTTENAVLSFVTGYLTQGTDVDAGSPIADAGGGAITTQNSSFHPEGGGCGCRLAHSEHSSTRLWLMAAAVLLSRLFVRRCRE